MVSRLVVALALALAVPLVLTACDPAPTTAPEPDGGSPPPADSCDKCKADELCVAAYDGTCIVLGVTCKPKTAACPAATCSAACAPYLCGTGADAGPSLSCATTHCSGKTPVAGAFGCYGP